MTEFPKLAGEETDDGRVAKAAIKIMVNGVSDNGGDFKNVLSVLELINVGVIGCLVEPEDRETIVDALAVSTKRLINRADEVMSRVVGTA